MSRYFKKGAIRSRQIQDALEERRRIEWFSNDMDYLRSKGFAIGYKIQCPVCSKKHKTFESLLPCAIELIKKEKPEIPNE